MCVIDFSIARRYLALTNAIEEGRKRLSSLKAAAEYSFDDDPFGNLHGEIVTVEHNLRIDEQERNSLQLRL